MRTLPLHRSLPLAAAASLALTACAIGDVRTEQADIAAQAKVAASQPPASRPVVLVHKGLWLLGEKIPATKPQPEIFDNPVVLNDSTPRSLAEMADWISRKVGVRVVIDPSAQGATPFGAQGSIPAAPAAVPMLAVQGRPANASPLPDLAGVLALAQGGAGAGVSIPQLPPVPLRYAGPFRGLLDAVDTRYAVWSRYRDGAVTFFRTETRTYTLPSLADTSGMSGSISTAASSSGGSSGSIPGSNDAGNSASSGSGSSSGSSSASGDQTMKLAVQVSPWASLQETASAVAGPGAAVVADRNLGTVTVTGTPPQCDRLEEWVKSLNAMFGKQVAIDVHVYDVQLTSEDNYGLNLALAYKSKGGHTGVTFAGASTPAVSSTSTPMSFGATILGGTLAGSSIAVQALSTLGNVLQLVSRSGVTQNGKLLALQAAREQDHVVSNTATLVASVGSSNSTQVSTMVSGFTGSFVPKVIDGRILVDFDMTLTDQPSFQTFPPGSSTNQSYVQLASRDIARFEQSVSLRPGETLVLTGMRQQTASVTNNGVGSASMPLLGGGVDAQKGDTILAVVISARLL